MRTNALLELMELESSVGDRMAFERRRAEAREGRRAGCRRACWRISTTRRAWVWRASDRPLAARANCSLAGLALAETHRLNAWYFRFEKVLANLTDCELREPEPATHPGLGELPAVRAVAVGLREYAAAGLT